MWLTSREGRRTRFYFFVLLANRQRRSFESTRVIVYTWKSFCRQLLGTRLIDSVLDGIANRTGRVEYLSARLLRLLSASLWKRRTSEIAPLWSNLVYCDGNFCLLGSEKDSLLLSRRCEHWSTDSDSWLLWGSSEIHRVWDWIFLFFSLIVVSPSRWRTFGFDDPCDSVHFQKTRLLFHQVEADICLAMVNLHDLLPTP